MTFAEKMQIECAKQGIYANNICSALGLSRNAFSYWKKSCSAPKPDVIAKIVNYLGLSTDEFMDGVDGVPAKAGGMIATVQKEEMKPISPQEDEILQIYRALGIKKQIKFLSYLLQLSDEA